MFRYLAFAWDSRNAAADLASRELRAALAREGAEWTQSLAVDGLVALHAGARPSSSIAIPMPNQCGVLFGTAFKRDDSEPLAARIQTITEAQALKALRTKGASWFSHYWGRFVAFTHDPLARTTWISRDPTGGLPCYRVEWEQVSVFYSFTGDCPVFCRKAPSINWSYIGAYVCSQALQSRQTALSDVEEILPGETLTLTRNKPVGRRLDWNPITIAQNDLSDPVDQITERLRRIAQHCVWTWAHCYPAIVHLLSGGLDSSIILACLKTSPYPPQVHCLNCYTQDRQSDEREYAALVAGAFGHSLIEEKRHLSTLHLEDLLALDPTTNPRPFLYYLDQCPLQGALARRVNATALFEGVGGDQVLYRGPVINGAIDGLRNRGVRASSLRLAYQIAFMGRVSFGSVLSAAIKARVGHTRFTPIEEVGKYRACVSSELLAAARNNSDFSPPWLATPSDLPRGKLWHILNLIRWPDFYDPFSQSDHPERVRPLVSQPLLELVLQVPTNVLVDRGWDRAIARRAFACDLPPELIHRRSKGVIDDAIIDQLQANITLVRELLLDGYLVREQILDRDKLLSHLTRGHAIESKDAGEITWNHLCTEVWLRRWLDGRFKNLSTVPVPGQTAHIGTRRETA